MSLHYPFWVCAARRGSLKRANQQGEDMAVHLTKQHIIDLSKRLESSAAMAPLAGFKAQVVLVLDISKSMNGLYRSGVVQRVIERLLALALNLDDDGRIDVVLFGTRAYGLPAVTLEEFEGYVERDILANYRINEATRYAPPLELIQGRYVGAGGDPVFVIFITDGNNSDKRESEAIIRSLAEHPIFIQFVGIGREDFPFLRKLDDLSGRLVDNAGFMHADDIDTLPDDALYQRLLNELPEWVERARAAQILR